MSGLSFGTRDPHCVLWGLACSEWASVQSRCFVSELRYAGSHPVTHGLQRTQIRQWQRVSFDPTTCGTLVPRPGMELVFPARQGGFTVPPEPSLNVLLINEQVDYMKPREKMTGKKGVHPGPKLL